MTSRAIGSRTSEVARCCWNTRHWRPRQPSIHSSSSKISSYACAQDIDLTRFNDFARAYGRFDFKRGNGDLVIEAQAENAQLNGYIKPLLRDVEVFDWEQDVEDEDKGVLRSLWEAIVGGSETLLKNQRRDQFATRVELSGSVHDQQTSAFQAFIAILRNGFVEAFTPRYERPPPQQDGS